MEVYVQSGRCLPDYLETLDTIMPEIDPNMTAKDFPHDVLFIWCGNDLCDGKEAYSAVKESTRTAAKQFAKVLAELPRVLILGPGDSQQWNLHEDFDKCEKPLSDLFIEMGTMMFRGNAIWSSLVPVDTFHFQATLPNQEKLFVGIKRVVQVWHILQEILEANQMLAGSDPRALRFAQEVMNRGQDMNTVEADIVFRNVQAAA